MSIHINVEFHSTIFDAMHYRTAFEISIVKFDMNYLFYGIFQIPMISCDFIISSGMTPWFFVVFLVGSNFRIWNFSLYFQTMAPEKACVVASSEVVFEVPDYGTGNIPTSSSQADVRLALEWGCLTPFDCKAPWACVAGVQQFCKLQNVPYLEWQCSLIKMFDLNKLF